MSGDHPGPIDPLAAARQERDLAWEIATHAVKALWRLLDDWPCPECHVKGGHEAGCGVGWALEMLDRLEE